MEYLTPNFTAEMAKSYTLLAPNMAPIQFALLEAALGSEGYHLVMLDNGGPEVAQLGLKYVHNDTCYPALLVIGQYLDALNSGKYDLEHTALVITQTGGGCRASNYIRLLRKALVRAGYENIPVASLNFTGMESGSTLPFTLKMIKKSIAALEYGDEIASLRAQVKPYEVNEGDAQRMCEKWIGTITEWFKNNCNYSPFMMKRRFAEIANDFAKIEVASKETVKVGVVGEIYVKFSPLGNNHLQDYLEAQGCEVSIPGIMGFIEYCIANFGLDVKIYGGRKKAARLSAAALGLFEKISGAMAKAMREAGFRAPGPFRDLMKKTEGIIGLGVKMGEGWLLSAEMAELIEAGFNNIICAQPFGCLPNHIAGKGVISRLRSRYPEANISAVDYDPGAAAVNQENRIKLMLAVAREKI